jgi:hypothetical protein
VLAEHPDDIQTHDALAAVEARIELTDFEAANYPGSDVRRFEKTGAAGTLAVFMLDTWQDRRAKADSQN